jgi:hypothetical protein
LAISHLLFLVVSRNQPFAVQRNAPHRTAPHPFSFSFPDAHRTPPHAKLYIALAIDLTQTDLT